MRIGILGTGNMADALGTQWARAGHELLIGGRTPSRAAALAERIGPRARAAGSLREAAEYGEAVLLAVAHAGVPQTLEQAGAADGTLGGKALIDCTNAVVEGFRLATDGGPGAAELIAAAARGAHVVKAFNLCQESAWRMTPPAFGGSPLAVPLCGDDPEALEVVRGLVKDIGCVPVDGGGLARARYLEAMTAFVIGVHVSGADPRAMLPPLMPGTEAA
jgi:predicted dinucleotide-binding enzyme